MRRSLGDPSATGTAWSTNGQWGCDVIAVSPSAAMGCVSSAIHLDCDTRHSYNGRVIAILHSESPVPLSLLGSFGEVR